MPGGYSGGQLEGLAQNGAEAWFRRVVRVTFLAGAGAAWEATSSFRIIRLKFFAVPEDLWPIVLFQPSTGNSTIMEHAAAAVAKMTLPANEEARLRELQSYGILDTPRDGAFDDITRLAAKYFKTPIAIVSLVDNDRIWFKSAQGLGDVYEIGRGPGLCASAILQDHVYVAPDLRNDPNSLTNPLVAGACGLRFYAAAPLRSKKGHNLGTLCVLDAEPRAFSEDDGKDLQRFAGLVMAQMDHLADSREIASLARIIANQNTSLIHAASHDPLTGLHNRAAAQRFFDELQRDNDAGFQSTILVLDVDHFKAINDAHGHETGDVVLVEVAKRLKRLVRLSDHVVRYGGEEFLIILRRCPPNVAQDIAMRLRNAVAAVPVEIGKLRLTISMSGGLCHSMVGSKVVDMMRSADAALYAAKNGGRACIIVAEDLAA